MQAPSCSIIVCTYNRAESLRATLEHLICQQYVADDLEILVVDNNSNDHTRDVVESISAGGGIPVRYLFEPVQGLSKARNTGVRASEADVVIFIDDDAYPKSSDWAMHLAMAFQSTAVGAAGGDAEPVWPVNQGRPKWLHDKLLPYLGIVTFGFTESHNLQYPHYPYGVNIAFRRLLILELGGFREGVGRQGEVLLSGEEIDLCLRVASSGSRVIYVPDSGVYHVMAPIRLRRDWFIRRATFQGISKAMIEWPGCSALDHSKLLIRRTCILLAAMSASLALALIGLNSLAFVAKCKSAMSAAYLRYALGSLNNAKDAAHDSE